MSLRAASRALNQARSMSDDDDDTKDHGKLPSAGSKDYGQEDETDVVDTDATENQDQDDAEEQEHDKQAEKLAAEKSTIPLIEKF